MTDYDVLKDGKVVAKVINPETAKEVNGNAEFYTAGSLTIIYKIDGIRIKE